MTCLLPGLKLPPADRKELWCITGGTGHVGLELAASLHAKGHDVRLLDMAPVSVAPTGVPYIKGDVTRWDNVWELLTGDEKKRSPDVVVHLAGAGMSGRGMLDRALCQHVNVKGTEVVVGCCERLARDAPIRLIFMSSYNVCFHGEAVHLGDETAPYSPASAHTDFYGASKADAERIVLAADRPDGLRTVALRPGAIFGERETRHLPRIVALMKWGLTAVAFGSVDALQDWLHVDNLVSALVLAAEALQSPATRCGGRAYFINDDEPVNTLEFMRPLARAVGCADEPALRLPLWVALAAGRVNEVLHARLGVPVLLTRAEVVKTAVYHTFSCQAARIDLGYAPLLTSTEGMRRVAAVYGATSGARPNEGRGGLTFLMRM